MELFKLLGTIAISGVEAANEQIGKVSSNVGKLGDTLSNIGTKLSDFGGKLTTRLSVPLTALGALSVKSAADVKAANSQFEQTFGNLQDTATKAINNVANASGILDTRLRGVGTSIYAFAKASGADSAEAMALMEAALQATADAAAYYDRSLDDTSESLMSFLKGNFANDAALGVSCTEVTRNAKAVELFGQKYNDLSEIQKQQTLLKMVTDAQALSGAMGQASRESDGFENVMGNLKESARLLSAEFGEVLLPTVIDLMQKLTGLLQSFNNMDEGTKKLILTIGGIAIAVGPVVTVIGKVTSGIGTIIKVGGTLIGGIGKLTPAITGLIGTGGKLITGIVSIGGKVTSVLIPAITSINPAVVVITAAIAALVAIGVALWKNWEDIASGAAKAWGAVAETVGGFVKSMGDFFSNCISAVGNFAKSIGDFFSNCISVVGNFVKSISDFFSNFISVVGGFVKSIGDFFSNCISAVGNFAKKFLGPFEAVKNTVQGIVESIKGFFKFEWKFPDIKLPHFKISWDSSGFFGGLASMIGLPGLPKIGVEWYKDGGIMTDPTAFGFNPYSGKVMAGGEAGPEAIAPISTLQSYVQEAVSESNYQLYKVLNQILALLTQYFPQMANKQLLLDTGALVGELAEPMNEELGKITYMRGRWN